MMQANNEFRETELYKRLISDSNIYLSIYSLESYIFNKELLSNQDWILMNKLKDKFQEDVIRTVIKRVRGCLNKLISDPEYFIEAQVYFKPKKYENGKVMFRPLHTASLISQIAMVSMLNMFIYEFNDGNEKLTLSNISRMIPGNFYGNRVSTEPEILFKTWQVQYKLYTQEANELFNIYHDTKEYRYEINLDLENFFPSVHPQMLYNLILSLAPVTLTGKELELYKVILIKLLICKISNLDSDTSAIYYGTNVPDSGPFFGTGIAQGLPQSYFLGNICMTEISKIFERNFKGISLFYVDDSVIFSNDIESGEDFERKLDQINKEIRKMMEEYIQLMDDDFFRKYNEEMITFLRNQSFSVQVHDTNGKSTYTEISQAKDGEIHLRSLSRAASQIGFELSASYSEEEDNNLNAKMEVLLEAIAQEQKLLMETAEESQSEEGRETYKAKLSRYLKYFKYRKMKLDVQRNDIPVSVENHNILIPTENKNFMQEFLEVYKYDIWGAYLDLCIKNNTDENTRKRLKKYLWDVNIKLFGRNNRKSSYIYTAYNKLLENKKGSRDDRVDPYATIGKLANKKFGRYLLAHGEIVNKIINDEIRRYSWDGLLKESGMFSEKFLDMTGIVDKSTAELKRMTLNALYSQLFGVLLDDSIVFFRKTKRSLTYGELRILALFRNSYFSETLYRTHFVEPFSENTRLKVDYSIMEVLEIFRTYVTDPILIDNLILVHQYTCDVWKNGSKYLYFYTLHNQEHAIDLIKNIIKIIKAIDYVQISRYDFYVLFIACYLHDISMVKIPSPDVFLLNEDAADRISMEFQESVKKSMKDNMEIKNLLMNFYKEIDGFFEQQIRGNHAKDSAQEIRNRSDLEFLDHCLRDKIAEISLAHGQKVEDVYNARSDAKNSLISAKFDKILLRLADLLDMSDYRVSKPILNHNMEQMSEISAFHWISHLLTNGYTLETEYHILDKDKTALAPHRIQEKLILHINVAFSQISRLENRSGCKYGRIDDSTISSQELVILFDHSCNGEHCNFLCKWFSRKNGYLLEELTALKAYLNRVPGNFYTTDIEIHIHMIGKTNLDARQFEILKKNLCEVGN